MIHNQRHATHPSEQREGPRGQPNGETRKFSKGSRPSTLNLKRILAIALLITPLLLLQFLGARKVPVALTSGGGQASVAPRAAVAMHQDLVAKSTIFESRPVSQNSPSSAETSVVAPSFVEDNLQPTRMQDDNVSHDAREQKPPVHQNKPRFKQTHNLNLDAEEYKRIMLLPSPTIAARVENVHKALEACYSCKPIDQHDLDHANIPDRLLYSEKYLPFLSTPLVKAVLNVGIRNIYDLQAEHIFRAKNPDVVYVTIEPHSEGNIFGASYYGPERSIHYQDYVENINNHPHPPFDVVLMHGVIGWGIDGKQGLQKLAVSLHKAMSDGGLLYMWRNFDSPADAFVPKEMKHGTVAVLEYLLPYFVRFNGTWHLNPESTIESEAIVDKHPDWTGRVDLLQRVTL
jgi:hypothetical protein